jgi:CpeT protein
MRAAPLLLLPLLAACPGPSPEPEPDPTPSFDAVTTFAEHLTGRFDSAAQAEADPSYFAIQLTTCPVLAPELGDTVLYVEQASMDTPAQPYRQRLYAIEQGRADGEARSVIYALTDPDAAVGLCDRDTPTFESGSWELRAGCDVFATWEADEERFVGGTEGAGCSSNLGEAAYATSEVTVEADRLLSWDRGFRADGSQAWGATDGPYSFVRRSEPEGADLDAGALPVGAGRDG